MQIALFEISAGDTPGLEELNRFLRGHRVLTVDRAARETGGWSFCVTYLLGPIGAGAAPGRGTEKIDYKTVLDAPTFALFSKLRELRKTLADREALPAYALFTNEQLADIAKARCRSVTDLGKIDGVGAGRMEKYGAAVLTLLRAELPAEPGAAQPSGESSEGRP